MRNEDTPYDQGNIMPNRNKVAPFFLVSTVLVALLLALIPADQANATALSSAVKQASRAMAKSSDEAVATTGRALEAIGRSSDEVLQSMLRQMDVLDDVAASADDVAARLVGAGLSDDAAQGLVRSLDDAGRRALVGLLDESSNLVRAASRAGVSADTVVGALTRGGDDALPILRSMSSPEATSACLRGMERFGEQFANFARQGDEAVVAAAGRNLDELAQLPAKTLDDVFQNPAKYFDINGRPLKAMDDLLVGISEGAGRGVKKPLGLRAMVKTGVLGTVIASAGIALCPDEWIDMLPIPESVKNFIKNAKWYIRCAWTLFLVWLLWPVLRMGFWLVRRIPLLLGLLLPGPIRRASRERIQRADAPRRFDPEVDTVPRAGELETLRIGLLGSRRAGKSTFIVMLSKFLPQLVDGASLQPRTLDPDKRLLDRITDEVAHCRPTEDSKELSLDLSWPFRRDGARRSSGKLSHSLVMRDFPGEWADPSAPTTLRNRLVDHLRKVDGLMVVIDPTDLETDSEGRDRMKSQHATLEAMFLGDGLDLARGFRRAMAVVITKRDAITPEMIDRWVEKSDQPIDGETLEEMRNLVGRPHLTEPESRRLGEWLLNLMCPGFFGSIKTQMASVSEARRRWPMRHFARRSSPRLAVFAISQLGSELGSDVVEYRKQVKQWEDSGAEGEKPSVSLDIDAVKPSQLEVQLPFRWLFNNIPAGWMHQSLNVPGWAGRRLLGQTHRRFSGSPEITRSRKIKTNRLMAFLVFVALIATAIRPAGHWWQSHLEEGAVYALFRDAASGVLKPEDAQTRIAACRQLETKPLVSELNAFKTIADMKNAMDTERQNLEDENRQTSLRIEAGRNWIRDAHRLTRMSTDDWPDDLQEYHRVVLRSAEDIAETTMRLCADQLKNHVTRVEFDQAEQLIVDMKLDLDQKPIDEDELKAYEDLPSYMQLETQYKTVLDDLANREQYVFKAKFESEVEALERRVALYLETEKFTDALGDIDELTIDSEFEDREKLNARVKNLRDDTIEKFWMYTQVNIEKSLRNQRPEDAQGLLDRFDTVNDLETYIAASKRVQNELPDRLVIVGIEAAKSALEKDDPATAWDAIHSVRNLLKEWTKVSLSIRGEWYRVASIAADHQQRWRSAITQLESAEVVEEPWARERRNDIWNRWVDDIITQFEASTTGNEIDDIKRLVTAFRADTASCPAETSDRLVKTVENALPTANLKAKLEQADELSNSDLKAAIDMLLPLEVDVRRTDASDNDLIGQWRSSLVLFYQRDGRPHRAAELLEAWKNDPQLASRLSVEDAKIDELWAAHSNTIIEQATASIKQNDYASAWQALFNGSQDETIPDAVRTKISDHATVEIDTRLANVKAEVDRYCGTQDFTKAAERVDVVRTELGRWMTSPQLALGTRMTDMERYVRAAKYDTEITAAADLVAKNRFEDADSRIKEILGAELTDQQRGRLSTLKTDNLRAWERSLYSDVIEARTDRNYLRLGELIEEYLDQNSAMAEARPEVRRKSAERVQKWLDQFETAKTYRITSFEYYNFPDCWDDYDPVFVLRIKHQTGNIDAIKTTCEGGADGDGIVTSFATNQSFTWRKNDDFTIEVWDDAEGDTRIGKIEFKDQYALLDMIKEKHELTYRDDYYKDDKELAKVRIAVRVSGLTEVPELSPLDITADLIDTPTTR